MKEIRLHGRGGQGAVLAAELLVVAAFEEGQYGQAFPLFGGERRGAPVQAFVRLDTRPVRVRHRVYQPDIVVILDRTLPNQVDVLAGLKPGGMALIDSEEALENLAWTLPVEVYAVPATRIALEVFHQPLVNPAMLGALAAVTGLVSPAALQQAFLSRFPDALGEKNCRAVQMGYDFIRNSHATAQHIEPCGRRPGANLAWSGANEFGRPGQPLDFMMAAEARTALLYPTGSWRYHRPRIEAAACNGCGVCVPLCPDDSLAIVERLAVVDYDYCKGCGICALECARNAIQMVTETGV